MYQVYCNDRILFDGKTEELLLGNASLDLELGKTGSFEFTIYPTHPNYDAVVPMARVTVSRNYETIYGGRVLTIKYGFYNEKQVACEGDLAFLLDSIIEPLNFAGSFVGYFETILVKHNAQVEPEKQFVRGNVTVSDINPYPLEEKEYKSSLDLLNTWVVEPSGGYLSVRYENGKKYLDFLSVNTDASNVSGQTIELGKNLLDINREFDGSKVFTAIIPLGAKIEGTEERLSITDINSGVPYVVNKTAAAMYGKIYRTVIFDNITNALTLLTTASEYITENYTGETSIEITAADLSGIDHTIDFFRLGQWVKVNVGHHFDYETQTFLIKKLAINLLSPASTKIVIGDVKKGLSEAIVGISNGLSNSISNSVNSIEVPEAVQPDVMESGTTGIWKWKKFADNTCEFFGKVPVTAYDITIALGGWYRGANIYDATTYAYPFEMTEAPAVNMTFQTRNGLAALPWVFSQDADTAQEYLPQCYLIRPVSGTGIYGNINIIGKGKLK